MAANYDLPINHKDMAAQLAGNENILWRYGVEGLAGHNPDTWRSDLESWLEKINKDPSLWQLYEGGKNTALHLATAMGNVILAAVSLKDDCGSEPFLEYIKAAFEAYGVALGVPRRLFNDSQKLPQHITWDQDQTPFDRLKLANEYLNELERRLPFEGRAALGMVRSAISDLVEPGGNRVLLGRLVFQVQLPVAVVLLGTGAAKGCGRAYRLTVEWFDHPEGKALLVRNPTALGCSVLDQQFGQAERAAWATVIGHKLFRETGFVRWGTNIPPSLEVVAIGGPSAGGALATALVSLGQNRQPVQALVLARLAHEEGAKSSSTATGTLYEVGSVAEKAIAASDMLRVGRVVLWQKEPKHDDAPEVKEDLKFLEQEHKKLSVKRCRTVSEVVHHLNSRGTAMMEYLRTHPRTKWTGIVSVLSLLIVATIGSALAYSSSLDREERTNRIAKLVREFEDDTKLEDWPLDRMKGHLEALAQDDVEIANANWITFVDKLRVRIETNPHLKKDEVDRYLAALEFLDSHDNGLAKSVRAVLESRRTHLQLQWGLPAEDIQKVFGPQTLNTQNGLLVLAKAKKDKSAARIASLEKCGPGGAQLEAKYDNSWLDASRLELELNATGENSGYIFSLHTIVNGPLGGRETFREARLKGGKIELGISRNNIPLLIENRDSGLFPDDTLTMTATREGPILTLQVGDLQPIISEDLFALSGKEIEAGHFALLWPKDVRIITLKAHVIMWPQKLSPLEEGDKTYSEGRYAEALKSYQNQAERTNKPEVDQEIRYKQGLCLVAERENERAKAIFKGLGEEKGTLWPLYACVQLWNLYILDDQMDLADELLDNRIRLHDRFELTSLVRCIPNKTRLHILSTYRNIVPILHGRNFGHTQRINAARRWVKVEELMKGDATDSRIWLSWAYHLGGFPDEAVEELRTLYRQSPTLFLLGEYVWLVRKTKSVDDALKLVMREEKTKKFHGSDLLYLALLKAECYAAMSNWEDVKSVLSQKVGGPGAPRHLCRAWLMLGFAHQKLLDERGAEKAWHEAQKIVERPTDRSGLLDFLISRSLAGVSDQTDVNEFLKRAFNAQPGSFLERVLTPLLKDDSLARVASNMWRTNEGRDLAQRLIFRDLSLPEQFSLPPTLALFEYARQNAFGASEEPQQLKVCWRAAEGIFRHGVEINKQELVSQALSALSFWKGDQNHVGINEILRVLPQSERAPVAYVAAHRMLQLKQDDKAAEYFNLSRDLSQEMDVVLMSLLKSDRELFDAKKGRLMIFSDNPGKVSLSLSGDNNLPEMVLANHEMFDLEMGHYRVRLGTDEGDASISPQEVNITRCGRAAIHIRHHSPVLAKEPLPGLVPKPTPQLGRWQLETREGRGGWKRIAWSPNGKLIAFACRDGHVRVKDADSGKLIHIFVGHTDEVECVAWSRDSRFLASDSRDQTVHVWDTSTKEPERPRELKPGKPINCLAWHPDGKRLLVGGPSLLCLWEARVDKPQVKNLLPGVVVSAVAWNPDGNQIAVVGKYQNNLIWKMALKEDGQVGENRPLSVPDSTKKLFCVAWSPNGERIAAGGEGQLALGSSDNLAPGGKSEVHAWDSHDGSLKWSVCYSFGLAVQAIAWNKDSNRLAVGTQAGKVCKDNYVSIHEGSWGKQIGCSPTNQPINSLFWSSDGSRLLSGHWDHSCRFWNADGSKLPDNEKFLSPAGTFNALTFDTNKNRFALGTREGTIRLGDLDGRNMRLITHLPNGIEHLAWNEASNRLAFFGWDANIYLRSTDSQMPYTKIINPNNNQICDIDWRRDGEQLVAGNDDGSVRIWNVDGREVEGPHVQIDGVRAVAWSPNQKQIAIGLGWKKGSILIWNVDKRSEGPHATGRGLGIIRLQWSPDGKYLASSSSNCMVEIWDSELHQVGETMSHKMPARSLAWSPNSKFLATGDDSGTCWIWTSKGEKVHSFKASGGRILGLAWSTDGKQLLSGSVDGSVQITNADSRKLIRLLVHLPGEKSLALTPRGEILSQSPNTDEELLYLVEGDAGYMKIHGMDEFRKHWNERVHDAD